MRTLVAEQGGAYTVTDARNFLEAADSYPAGIADLFGTRSRRRRLGEALDAMEHVVEHWTYTDRRDARFSWILPAKLAQAARRNKLTDSDLAARIVGVEGWSRRRHYLSECSRWMPFLSLEGVNELRRLRSADVGALQTSLALTARDGGHSTQVRPWHEGTPQNVMSLPITWLYQYSPTPRFATVLSRLTQVGYSNIGHLAILHPASLRAVGRMPKDRWFNLARGLRN
jgi:hypothetical protein